MKEKGNIVMQGLTQGQLAIYAGQRLHPEVPLYNMAHSFEIPLAIDLAEFQRAFQSVIAESDALRTVFIEEKGDVYQTVKAAIAYTLEHLDFSSKDRTYIQEWLSNRSRMNFDLSERLFDSVLLKMGPDRTIWFLNVHHLVTDATSSTLLYKRTLVHYFGTLESQAGQTFPKYQEYVAYETRLRLQESNFPVQEYWNVKTKELLNVPPLYGNNETVRSTHSERVALTLGPNRAQKLKQLALLPEIRSFTPNLTLFNLFATLLFAFIHRVSGQKKLALGAPALNRPTKAFRKTPGLFIEIFPLVSQVEDTDSFMSLLGRIKLETNDYLRYAQPGGATPQVSKSFNAVLNYITASFDDMEGISAKSEWIHPGHCDPAHHLRCHVYDFDASGNIHVYFDLNEKVFGPILRQAMPQHFLNLLDALLEDIHQPLTRASLITENERQVALSTTSPPKIPLQSVMAQFERQLEKNPDGKALVHNGTIVSYRELNDRTNQWANLLKKKDVVPGDNVSLYLERSPEYIIAVLATLKLGASFVPIASDQPKDRVAHILADSKSKALVSNSRRIDKGIDVPGITLNVDLLGEEIKSQSIDFQSVKTKMEHPAYRIYTSGTTGKPKGVVIPHSALANYLNWGKAYYALDDPFHFPLFTSISFDLTLTATFMPLISGGTLYIYTENFMGPDVSLLQVIQENKVNSIKLTPSHLALLEGIDVSKSLLRLMIVGGEDFKSKLARSVTDALGKDLGIYNEYGPTEATIGCIVQKYDGKRHLGPSVPIGRPIQGIQAFVLDAHENMVPQGVIGRLFLGGAGLAHGYTNTQLSKQRFMDNPFLPGSKMYDTGDMVRWNQQGELEYLGRVDEQVKLNGFRIELSDIEHKLGTHPAVEQAAVVLLDQKKGKQEQDQHVVHCKECGLPSSYPNVEFDANDVCHLCNAFKGYKEKTDKYFKTENDLQKLLTSKKGHGGDYDCLALLSGGKDSTYVLARLVNMGLKVLSFTLDNGYISEQAKSNIIKITQKLGVDHIYGETPHMNKVFVDSLHRHKNVCNGCFKVIYTLSTQVALEKGIPFVVTGLSRGQFFETRLTEELFWNDAVDTTTIDDTILQARKLYHQEEDAVKQHLDTSMFALESTFEKVQFVDFYRYSDVSLNDMLAFLKEKVGWVRPTDTGRSTNCLINQAGIHVHKKERGYSNYSFPYSWDVRLGHKNRDEALEEINEYIDVKEVERMLEEIGYTHPNEGMEGGSQLVGYYTGKKKISPTELKRHLTQRLPEYMVPLKYKFLETLPLTLNGKVDKIALRSLTEIQIAMDTPYEAPGNEIEVFLEGIWKEVLQLPRIGVHDNFIALGGHSLAAIRVTARINDELQIQFPLNKVFELPTLSEYAKFIGEQLTIMLQEP